MMGLDRCPSERRLLRAPARGMDARLSRHIEECPSCHERWQKLRRLAALGAGLPEREMATGRGRAIRDAILARVGASAAPSRAPRSRWFLAALGAAAAALALVLLVPRWLSPSRDEPSAVSSQRPVYRGTVHPHQGARFLRIGSSPDEIVRLFDGRLTVQVEHLAPGERFRVMTNDGEVEVRGTAFEVQAEEDHLRAVWVLHGRVAVRGSELQAPIELGPGQRWESSRRQQRAALAEPSPATSGLSGRDPRPLDVRRPAPEPPVGAVAPARSPVATAARSDSAPARGRTGAAVEAVSADPDAPAAGESGVQPSAAELRYQEGWGAMRAGDFGRAVSAFEGVLGDPTSSLAQDARYWHAVSLGRAHRDAEAVSALRDYLGRYAGSARAAEAHAMLGWLLLDRGDREEARAEFRAALRSGATRGRESAQRGLSRLEAEPPDDSRGR